MTLYLPRQDIHYPFIPNTKVMIMINLPGYENIQDTEGNLVEEYNLTFWIEPIVYQTIAAQPEKGFNWPYLLYVPESAGNSTRLLVEPNNSGVPSDEFAFHEVRAESLVNMRSPFSYVLKAPLLVPIFPRYEDLYTQALDRATLLTQRENLIRIDLQLIAMVDDAIERLAAMGIKVNKRFFMIGFSASGAFVSRFSAIHPERIMAAAIGAPGGWPIAPVAEWWGHDMTYDLGISDLDVVTGAPFNLSEFKMVPLFLYLGEQDDNWDSQDVSTELHFLGKTIQERWVVAEDIYQSIGSSAEFVLYPGVGHIITNDMWLDIEAFLIKHRMRRRVMPWLFLLLEN
jgi:pimeloyl-ACP methyl ester carboxylesterase